MTATAPKVLPVDADGIPTELKERRQWVLWRLVTRDGRPTKLPYQIGGAMAKSDDPATWTTFDAALAAYQRGGYSGIGYVFTADDPYVGIDLDDCIDPDTDAVADWALEIMRRLDTYSETSPSGTGIKLWARGTLPTEATGKKRPYKTGAVEVYQRGRYFAVTGADAGGAENIGDAQEAINWLWRTALADPQEKHQRNGQQHAAYGGDLQRIVERARKYIAIMPAAVSGQGGHDAAFSVACALVSGFALTPEQAYPLMAEYSEICQPPWSDNEIWHKLRSADKKPGDRGYLRHAERNDYHATASTAGTSKAQPENEAERIEYQLVTCRELDSAEYDLEYLIDHMLVARQPCIFAGGKKCLKTSLLIDLAISLAMGGKFLGQFNVRRAARVLVMTGESGMATIQETARRIAAAQGFNLADIGGLIFSPQLPLFGHLLHADALTAALTLNEIEVLVVDPAYLAMQTDGNEASLFAMGAMLRAMSELCQKIGVTFVLAHHTRKTLTDPFAPPELEDIAWAGFNEFARQWVLIGRRERYEPGSGNHRLWINAGGSAGHSSCWAMDVAEGVYDGRTPRRWEVYLMRAEDARQEAQQRQEGVKEQKRKASSAAQLEADRKTVVGVMVKMPDNAGTKTEIKERSHLSTGRLSAALASLADDGTVSDCEITKGNNRPYPAWKLRPDNEQ